MLYRFRSILPGLFAVAAGLCLSGAALAATPTIEEMWEVIQQQQLVINDLKARLDVNESQLTATEVKIEDTAIAVEITADAVEQVTLRSQRSIGKRTSVGGYGELHYNNLSDDNESHLYLQI